MLILPNGYNKWKQAIEKIAPDLEKPGKKWYHSGFNPVNPKDTNNSEATASGWALPKNFCPGCNRNDLTETEERKANPGMYIFQESMPEIDYKKSDIIVYFTCHECATLFTKAEQAVKEAQRLAAQDMHNLNQLLALPAHTQQQTYEEKIVAQLERNAAAIESGKRQHSIENNILEWIKAEKLRGNRKIEAGS